MTVERTKHRRGAFEREEIWVDLTKPRPEDKEAHMEYLDAASFPGRIAKWKPHAERLGVGLVDIQKAETLLTAKGGTASWADHVEFNLHMEQARADIETAQVEESFVPLAVDAVKTKKQRKRGGANSHEMSEDDRRERNEQIQEDLNRLCLKKGLTFMRARVLVARKYSLHPDTLKRIAKNPLK